MGVSDSDTVAVGGDGVSVEKSFEPDEFPVPAIAFVVRSERDAPVTVRLVDDLPEGVGPDDVGFHPDYGEECWSVEAGRIVFERTFGPEESYTTVYGLRDGDLDSVARFLGDPTVETSDPDAGPPLHDVIPSATGTADADGETDDGDDDGSDEERDEEEEEIVPLDLDDPAGGGVPRPLPPDDGGTAQVAPIDEAESPGGTRAAGNAEGVASALAAELRAGTVEEDVAATLREHLGVAAVDDTPNSVETRLRHVQGGLSDLRAYIDALEAFIDENGDARQALGDLRAAVESLDGRVDGVGERVAAVDDRVSAIDERTGAMGDRLADVEDGVEERLDVVEERVGAAADRAAAAAGGAEDVGDGLVDVEVRVDGLRDDLSAVEGSLDDLRAEAAVAADVEATTERLAALEAAGDRIEGLADRLDGLEEEFDRVEGLSNRLDRLEGTLDEVESLADRVGAVESDLGDRLGDVEADVAAFEGFRERMASAFGATGPADAGEDRSGSSGE